MFEAASIEDFRTIADIAAAVFRDDHTMQEYIYPGSTGPGSFRPTYASEIHGDAEVGRFDGPERTLLKEFIAGLSPEARYDVIAVIDIGRDAAPDLAEGRKQARHMPEDYQKNYIHNRANSCLRKGLNKLGITI